MRILWSAPADFLELESWDWPGELVIGPPAKHLGVEVWVVDPIQRVIPRQIRRYPKLRLMVTPSTGTDHLPLDYMLKKGIEWRSLLDDRTALEDIRASSEFTFLLLLAVLRNFPVGYLQLKSKRRRDESVFRGNELFQKRIGIIGLGRIGKKHQRLVQSIWL